ncbi:MAG: hypothetical protein COS96_01525 [Candidatus Nealsonbacteria bacterium CG07_land_8_20_14_0_80_39_13]|nr:MAG: hypothetical protein COS96_01525 [Candidatus Nealsonbacteria bacterium CG07_land_8_20_14_0_80_39_13]
MRFEELRKKYPKFVYQGYSYRISDRNLEIFFEFRIGSEFIFNPKITIENIDKKRLEGIKIETLDNLVFNLGMIEALSYWKATCSPLIEIKCGFLNAGQVKWWKDLMEKGLGQFFYENKIDFDFDSLRILSDMTKKFVKTDKIELKNRVLAPIGGGKDSIVTFEVLKETKNELSSFCLNPTGTAMRVIKGIGCRNFIIIRREIDKKLLELNRAGFLNGHTPFSAYLSFLSILIAVIFNYRYVAISQESSSNEGNVKYLGKIINHQYSKTFDFEKRFKDYCKKYLVEDFGYFSFLRPLNEIQIARIFADFPKFFPIFMSCNEAYKTASGTKKPTGKWCGNCSKCLFAWLILYPFVEKSRMEKIFNQDLFGNKNLLNILKELIGEKGIKPFECVGTHEEVLVALYLSWKKEKEASPHLSSLPILLGYFEKEILPKYGEKTLEKKSKAILESWNKRHNLPKNFEKILKDAN